MPCSIATVLDSISNCAARTPHNFVEDSSSSAIERLKQHAFGGGNCVGREMSLLTPSDEAGIPHRTKAVDDDDEVLLRSTDVHKTFAASSDAHARIMRNSEAVLRGVLRLDEFASISFHEIHCLECCCRSEADSLGRRCYARCAVEKKTYASVTGENGTENGKSLTNAIKMPDQNAEDIAETESGMLNIGSRRTAKSLARESLSRKLHEDFDDKRRERLNLLALTYTGRALSSSTTA